MKRPFEWTSRSARRRQRAAATQARVVVPILAVITVEIAVAVTAGLLGLSGIQIVLMAVGVAVVAAIIERQTIGSLVAGAGIRVARPYAPGEQVRLFVPSLNSVEDAEVVRVGAANTTLMTSRGLVLVSNSRMLRGNPECQGKNEQSAA